MISSSEGNIGVDQQRRGLYRLELRRACVPPPSPTQPIENTRPPLGGGARARGRRRPTCQPVPTRQHPPPAPLFPRRSAIETTQLFNGPPTSLVPHTAGVGMAVLRCVGRSGSSVLA